MKLATGITLTCPVCRAELLEFSETSKPFGLAREFQATRHMKTCEMVSPLEEERFMFFSECNCGVNMFCSYSDGWEYRVMV